jgi:hypothetical protein
VWCSGFGATINITNKQISHSQKWGRFLATSLLAFSAGVVFNIGLIIGCRSAFPIIGVPRISDGHLQVKDRMACNLNTLVND